MSLVERIIQVPQFVWDMADLIIVPDLPPPYTISKQTLNIRDEAACKVRYVGPIFEEAAGNPERAREEVGCTGRPLVLVVVSGGVEEKAYFVGKFVSMGHQLDRDVCYVMSTATPWRNETYMVGG